MVDLLDQTELLGLDLVSIEDVQDGGCDDRDDDGEAPERPLPGALLVESRCNGWTGKGGRDVGGCGEGECQRSVLEVGGVGDEDVENVGHAIKADPVEALVFVSGGLWADRKSSERWKNSPDPQHKSPRFGSLP
jgi:hypothetical protein